MDHWWDSWIKKKKKKKPFLSKYIRVSCSSARCSRFDQTCTVKHKPFQQCKDLTSHNHTILNTISASAVTTLLDQYLQCQGKHVLSRLCFPVTCSVICSILHLEPYRNLHCVHTAVTLLLHWLPKRHTPPQLNSLYVIPDSVIWHQNNRATLVLQWVIEWFSSLLLSM